MIDFERIGKWFFIAMGLLLLVGVTGWFSGGNNGNLIFSYSIIAISLILGIGFMIIKWPELRYGKEKIAQMKNEVFEKEQEAVKKESDIWDSLTKDQRKNICERLGISSKYAKFSLANIPLKNRKMLVYIIDIELSQKEGKEEWSQPSHPPTYYEMLGIEKNSSEIEIKDAFRKNILRWHSDKNKIKDADEYTKILYEAREVLLDPNRRRQYDATIS